MKKILRALKPFLPASGAPNVGFAYISDGFAFSKNHYGWIKVAINITGKAGFLVDQAMSACEISNDPFIKGSSLRFKGSDGSTIEIQSDTVPDYHLDEGDDGVKIRCLGSSLSAAMKAAMGFASPIDNGPNNCLYIISDRDALTVLSTDSQVIFCCTIEAEVSAPIAFAVPKHGIALESGYIDMNVNDTGVLIRYEDTTMKLAKPLITAENGRTYVSFVEKQKEHICTLDAEDIKSKANVLKALMPDELAAFVIGIDEHISLRSDGVKANLVVSGEVVKAWSPIMVSPSMFIRSINPHSGSIKLLATYNNQGNLSGIKMVSEACTTICAIRG